MARYQGLDAARPRPRQRPFALRASTPANAQVVRATLSRREFLGAGALGAAGLLIHPSKALAKRPDAKPLVLYCSADADLARPIIEGFTKQTGIIVKTVFDTEATKTTGLVNRLLAEKDRPRADVWWSSEPFGTIQLARAGVLEAYTSASAERQMEPHGGVGGWPKSLRGSDGTWYGFGSRARVIGHNTNAFRDGLRWPVLFHLSTLSDKGRMGMARPQFGTTRGHMAWLYAEIGEKGLRVLLQAWKHNGMRLFDGNAAVARALGTGEIHIGLTDSDDVFAAQGRGWPVEFTFGREVVDVNVQTKSGCVGVSASGNLFLPNTIGTVAGAEDGASARTFIDHMLSKNIQKAMAASESRNIPVDPDLYEELSKWAEGGPAKHPADYERIADHIEAAMKVCDEVLG